MPKYKVFSDTYIPVMTCNKKHLPKQVVLIAYTMEKTFFAIATFEGL